MKETIKKIISTNTFEAIIIWTIIVAGIVIWLQTDPILTQTYGSLFEKIDTLILWIFLWEAVLKIYALWRDYFKDNRNIFDFIIVVWSILPVWGSFMPVFRLLRILRVLRLVSVLPKLRSIVDTMLHSIPSMWYVFIILLLTFYIYGVIWVTFFWENDPYFFWNIGNAILSLFAIATFDDRSSIMKISMLWCDMVDYDFATVSCTNPKAQPFTSVIYFLSFVVIAWFIIINLVIWVIFESMEEVKKQREEEERITPLFMKE